MKKILQTLALSILLQFAYAQTGNVGVGTATPDASAALEVSSTSKGLLIPRVSLTATNSASPITSPLISLLVYNTNTSVAGTTQVTPGYYFWNGTSWIRLLSTKLANANNGLSVVNDTTIQLGGTLIQTTTITQGSNTFTVLNNGTTNTVINLSSTGDFDVQDNGTSALFVRDDGNVGIGTNAPAEKLNVNGSVFIPDAASYWIGNNADAGERLRMHHSGIQSYIDFNSGDLNFRPAGAPKIIFKINGDEQINNLAGVANRPVYANAAGVLGVSSTSADAGWVGAANLMFSRDDIGSTGSSSGVPAGATFTAAATGDEVTTAVNLPFTFYINGMACTWVSLSSNGFIQFNTSNSFNGPVYINTALPSGSFSLPTLCYYWDDMTTTGNAIRYTTLGTSPNRVFLVDFELNTYSGAFTIKGQVMLHEGSNIMNVTYASANAYACGQLATLGLQLNTTSAIPLSYNLKVLDDNIGNIQGISFSPSK